MKIINYNYGYNNDFDCSIHGKIVMTKKEWEKAKSYLLKAVKDSFWKNLLKEDISRTIETKEGKLLNIRVPSTEKLVERFKTTGRNYKQGRYILLYLWIITLQRIP